MEPTATAAKQLAELEAHIDHILASPSTGGTLDLIVARPAVEARLVLETGALDPERGLEGDCWRERGTSRGSDADPDKQLTLMSSRVIEAVAGSDRDRWSAAGDQLYVDLDLSYTNLPGGTRLHIGDAVVELTASPHRGCAKFGARFGEDAWRFVNARERAVRSFRGRNATVVRRGRISQTDRVVKVPAPS